ncbi:hypothetical protein QNO00_12945, partial [Arthrobacter sp. zg-Y1219]|uniref:hypothetical protein n=1 Tax=Arthrobacter sp. zg-Y1219 TaxID=3049067 RepID=UPI0024C3CF0F
MYYSRAAKDDSRAPGPDASNALSNALSTAPLPASGASKGAAAGLARGVEDLEAAERVCLINEIRALEELKCVAAAAQAKAAAAFDAST